jgi:hypothetical protein
LPARGVINKDPTVWRDGGRRPPKVGNTPMYIVDSLRKKYISEYTKISEFGAILRFEGLAGCVGQTALNKDPTVWLDAAR